MDTTMSFGTTYLSRSYWLLMRFKLDRAGAHLAQFYWCADGHAVNRNGELSALEGEAT